MNLGLSMFATDYAIRADELAQAAEARGFESLWLPEHTHIPVSRRSPWPGGGDLPREYWHTFDPFVALMAAGAATRTLKLGTGVCLIIERDTIVTAKMVASLDQLCGGRLLFGIGAGWNAEEMENHGTVFKTRFKRLREQVLAMKAIWGEDEAEFHGSFVDFDPIWSWPKPLQRPHPPVHLGGSGPYTLRRVVEFCDGWIPLGRSPGAVLGAAAELRQCAERAGRDFAGIELSAFGASPEQDLIDRFADAGFSRVILGLASQPRDQALAALDALVPLVEANR